MVKEVLMSGANNNTSEKALLVRRGRVDSVDLYEVKEHELEILENGEQTGLFLNFSIFLLSLAFSGILTLSTATFSNTKIENTFLFITILGVLGGLFLLILWWRGRKSIKYVVKKIKDRIPAEYMEPQKKSDVQTDPIPVEDDKDVLPEG